MLINALLQISTDDLIGELKRRKDNTYLEDAEWLYRTRGRGHSSLARKLLLELNVGDVKRLNHEDVYCKHREKYDGYECGILRNVYRLGKKGMEFHVYHEKEHVAIIARIS